MANRLSHLVVVNAMVVLFLGLVAGLLLTFAMLESIALWPIPGWDVQVPGSTRGWQAAHVGGILNAVMIVSLLWLTQYLNLDGKALKWSAWSLIITGWGNTLFYWAGNFSTNRGLSVADTPYGPGDIWGSLAYLGGGTAMVFTFTVVIILGLTAYRKLQQ